MPLVLTLREKTSIPIEVDHVRIETALEQSLDEIRATPVQYGNKRLTVDDFFDASGSCGEDEEIIWEGDCAKVKLIGTLMSRGKMTVRGNAGMHLGAEMSGGEILCEGDAGDWVGAEMHGGRIHVRGSAGHLIGAVYRGGGRGMTGGEILIDGGVGNEIGHTMRRGLIAVGGRCGDAPGFNMIAGSILLFGETGMRPGAGMRRGTIGLFATDSSTRLLPTFKASSTYDPTFLRFTFRHLQSIGFDVPEACLGAQYSRFRGDFLDGGKGEILVLDAQAS